MLLQFETDSGPVTVLADGGVTGYPSHWVRDKLPTAVERFRTSGRLHIDLVIATHYDGDHLIGLGPIIRDPRVTIGEAWLPPVTNDADHRTIDDRVRDEDYLALQLGKPGGRKVLDDYLRSKARNCERLATLEQPDRLFTSEISQSPLEALKMAHVVTAPFEKAAFSEARRLRKKSALAYFKGHFDDSRRDLGRAFDSECHADEDIVEPDDAPPIAFHSAWKSRLLGAELDGFETMSLSMIRKSEAKKAITAIHLADVVNALTARGVRMRAATISDGEPRRFIWKAADRRFIPARQDLSDGPELTLLGPSDGLVARHREQIPVGTSVALFKSAMPLEPITPSNQLSYVMRFTHAGQAILVTGDSGFVDFKPSAARADYYQPLLDCIRRLDVVQVAHHGGHNAHFYRCLVAAGFSEQEEEAFLLLSHGVDDKHRPSEAFADFIERARADSRLKLLFTSRPQEAKVRDFIDLIHPVVGGQPSDRGDIRLSFDGTEWSVQRHQVKVLTS